MPFSYFIPYLSDPKTMTKNLQKYTTPRKESVMEYQQERKRGGERIHVADECRGVLCRLGAIHKFTTTEK